MPLEVRSQSSLPVTLVVPASKRETNILEALRTALTELKNHVDGVYLHIDMDVLHTEQGQPNHLAVPGGLPGPSNKVIV